jgi:Family of unknown function (DUF6152)
MKCKAACLIALALLIPPTLLVGHHAVSMFDINKVLTLRGNVTKVDWMNPHPYIYLDLKDDNGSYVNWSVEFSDLNKLRRVGLEKDMIEIGKEITIIAYPARTQGDFAYLEVASNLPMSHAKTQRFARAKEVLINGRRTELPGAGL